MNLGDIQILKSKISQPKTVVPKKERRSEEELIIAAQEKDKKMDRTRKTPTKQEKQQQLFETMVNYQEIPEEAPVVIKKSDDEWDVKIGDPIEYFDPELSYELTGYRPITATKGLDFDPKLFTVAADTYKAKGKYTDLIPGTFSFQQHWQEEFNRCQSGCTIGKYRLTGENYFFLNYFRLPSVLDKSGQETQEESFPAFLAKQYEYFHYMEMCRATGHDGVLFKSRGVGASQIAASNAVNAYMYHKASRNIITAFQESYVSDTLSKCWQELDFLNTQTQGAFKRVRMKIDTNWKKKASKVDQDKNETGWGSIIEGVISDEPRKLRGARVLNLYIEESGSHPNLIPTYIQSRALVVINGYRVGTRWCFGTAGDKTPNLAGLKDMFYNPQEYLALPYRHNYTKSGDYTLTGYFIPSYTMWFGTPEKPGFDSRGVVDEERAKAYYEATWATIKDPTKLIQDKAEYCFTPEDAFVLEGSNNFDQEKLAEQKAAIEIHKTIPLPRQMQLRWQIKENQVDYDQRPIAQVGEGPIRFTEMPVCDEHGIPFKNLYVIGVDGIDQGTNESSGQTDVSKFAIVVYRRQLGLQEPKIVAIYKERPRHIKDAWDICLKLAMFYNAKVLIEYTKISVVHHFKNVGKEHYLMHKPQGGQSSGGRRTVNRQIGVTPTQAVIEHYLELIENYIVDYYQFIDYTDLLDELISYSYENKRKFDLVAAFGCALLADEELRGRPARADSVQETLSLGYTRNEYGQVKLNNTKQNEQTQFDYSRGNRFKFY